MPSKTEKRIKALESEINKIRYRNKSVEGNKAWETSYSRRLLLMLFTFLAIGAYMWAINIQKPWLNAIVPSVAFMLSTLTLPFIKKKWVKYCWKK
ncbi:hypothetical protein HOC35_03790 [Candidatus Woesearchaeota archaeon]|jgi:hypothetical protein|nr:hypothetical protein [Candidatus Woesearchaeota archaeon]